MRNIFVWLHRWIGLSLALFLVTAGITGSLLAFHERLDALLVPRFYQLPDHRGARMLDPVTLRERAAAARPDMVFNSAWAAWQRDRPVSFYMYARQGNEHGRLYLDPYDGHVVGMRFDSLSEGAAGVMPFIERLHYSLALGALGTMIFGIVALLWTLDCFIGAYLTLPRGRPFWTRWSSAWTVKRARLHFDLHRAGGLWTWAMLLVFAWSGVAFNLPQLYYPVTAATLGYTRIEQSPTLDAPQVEPGMGWRAGYERGQTLMRQALAEHHIGTHREDALHYDPWRAEFNYYVATRFHGDGRASDWFGVSFDANSGALRRVRPESLPREAAGNTVSRWIADLHRAEIGGYPLKFAVSLMGLVVAALSITGVKIWRRKRDART